MVGFKYTCVYYDRTKRAAGKSSYTLANMIYLAFDGITSFSIRPIRLIIVMGVLVALVSFLAGIWFIIGHFLGRTIQGWTSMTCIICFLGGVQMFSLGVIGEYIGKIYMETKHRPRYIIKERVGL